MTAYKNQEEAEAALKELAMMVDEDLQISSNIWLKLEDVEKGTISFVHSTIYPISKGLADKSREILLKLRGE